MTAESGEVIRLTPRYFWLLLASLMIVLVLAVLVHRFLYPCRVAALAVDSTQCGYKKC